MSEQADAYYKYLVLAGFRNGPVLFWISVFGHCWIATFPLIVFFLTLDRILTIKYPGGYSRVRLLYTIVPLDIAFLLFNFFSFYSALPVPRHTQCWTHGCLMETKLEFYLYWRTGCAFVNCITGFVFFFLMWKRQHSTFAVPPQQIALWPTEM
uniref:Uncharacterized protein n=1 Tax=Ditylenchus dipsaci TaxID=166011 RepID=A0A915DKQ2_9BILA